MWVNISEKNTNIFSSLRPCYHRQANKKNLFCHWKNTSTLWRTWSLALSVHNFFSHLHFFKVGQIKLLKYGNLMLPAGQILYIYCVQLSNAAPFRQNYTKLSFDAKHLEKGFNRGWVRGVKFLDPFFKKKMPFLVNIERCPKFLEYALTRGISIQS